MGIQTSKPLTPNQYRSFSDRARGAGHAIEDQWDRVLPRIESFCRERPLTAIGIGLVLGVALRSLISRR
jgi:ElaB/YqjD/DUF883 family membrane-anchored ribosome-binding protein